MATARPRVIATSPARSTVPRRHGRSRPWSQEPNAHITRSTVRLNAARPLSDGFRAKVTVHEFGHVLSLRHRSYRPRATVMDAYLRGSAYPTLLDRLTLGSIY